MGRTGGVFIISQDFTGLLTKVLAGRRLLESVTGPDSVLDISHFLFSQAQRRAGLMRCGQRASPQKRRRSPRYSGLPWAGWVEVHAAPWCWGAQVHSGRPVLQWDGAAPVARSPPKSEV